MKVFILHPPLYPVNNIFFEELGKLVDLTVFSFGKHPGLHKDWKASNYRPKNYSLVVLNGNTDLRRKAVSLRTQMNVRYLREIVKHKPDIVVSVAFWLPSLLVNLLKCFQSFKTLIITDATGNSEVNTGILKLVLRKMIFCLNDGFIASSDFTMDYLKGFVSEKKIYKSLHTIDVDYWKKTLINLPSKIKVRKELGLPEDEILFLGVGNFTMQKNWQSAIDNLGGILSASLILVGDGPLKDNYTSYARERNVNLILLDKKFDEELVKLYKACDVFLFPTLNDTFGFVVMEALVSGMPVLCSKFAGASSIILEGYNGYIIDPEVAYINKIKLVVKKRTELSENAIRSVDQFTMLKKAQEMFNVFKGISKEK